MIKDSNVLLVQPQYTEKEQWAALSRGEGLFFEAAELYMAPAISLPERFESCREWYKQNPDLALGLHGAFIDVNPASGDPAFRELSRSRSHESCVLARELGARHVVLHASALPFIRGAYIDFWAGQCADFYAALVEQYDIELHIENSQDVDTVPLRMLMDRINDPRVGICLDIGHVNYSLASVEQWFDELGDRINYLHLSDNMGHFDDHMSLGTGNVDWEKVSGLWKQTGRFAPMTMEVGGLDNVKQSICFLREHGYFGFRE